MTVIFLKQLDMVTCAYNPIYAGDRDKEDCGSRPAQAKS
jgi:hypothetical protein